MFVFQGKKPATLTLIGSGSDGVTGLLEKIVTRKKWFFFRKFFSWQ